MDRRIKQYVQRNLSRTYPEYDIAVTNIATGTFAAKLLTEDTDIEADIAQ